MVTVSDLPNFSGVGGEDASQWLKSFVIATRGDNEGVMLRMFPTYLEPDSPAQVWHDDLSDDTTSNWKAFERKFRQRWVSRIGGRTSKTEEDINAGLERFRHHHLTDDAIFAPTSIDVAIMNRVVVDWADDHLQLGKSVGLDDASLIQATTHCLPAFMRAFLKYETTPPTTFQMLCTMIREITDPVLEFEQLRRQEASTDLGVRMERMEKKFDDLLEILKSEAGINQRTLDAIPATTGAEEDDTAFLAISEEWKSINISGSKAQMVATVKETITTLRKCQASEISIDAAVMINTGLLLYYDAIASPGQFDSSSVVGEAGHRSTVLWQAIFRIKHQQVFHRFDNATEALKTWESFSDSNQKVPEECIYGPNHSRFVSLVNGFTYNISSQCSQFYGGVIQCGKGVILPFVGVSSFNTALYIILSVYLGESPTSTHSDSKYTQAAINSANWIKKWAYDENTCLVKVFTWDVYQNKEWGTSSLSPHMTGLFIEGLCILASVTGEPKWKNLAITICDAAMVYRDWHDDNGVFRFLSTSGPAAVDDANTFRGLLFRGLSVAYQRNPTDRRLRHTIRSYINVQFNALRDGPHPSGSYPVAWNKTSSDAYVHGQMAALDVLMAAVIVNHC